MIAIRLAAPWNRKAAQLVQGRSQLFTELEKNRRPEDEVIWVHCASAGELEQAKPVVEELKKQFPSYRILISFFSPSGFAAGKKYRAADIITYLPADTAENARRFVELVRPELVIFVKYEYWFHHLSAVAFRHIPLLLIAAIFRKDQVFFKWYGSFFRQMLFLYRRIFVQDQASADRLKEIGAENTVVAGDTRFDRVIRIRQEFSPIPVMESFVSGGAPVIIAGSTWPEDEELFTPLLQDRDIRLVLAPHEINDPHLAGIASLFPDAVRFSQYNVDQHAKSKVLIIDNFGMLSRLYQYATVSYVGGGFNTSGIHNTLEAAVYGKPVIFGPHYQKFREARELVKRGAAFSVRNRQELAGIFDRLMDDRDILQKAGEAAARYVHEETGATEKIIRFIQENRLLTRR